jgi:hypothetical protein
MKCYLYLNDDLWGWADLQPAHPSRSCVAGAFHPNENYSTVQPLIREAAIHITENGTLGEHDNAKLASAFKAKDKLNLRVRTESGIELEAVGPIFLEEINSGDLVLEIQLEVYGLDGRVLEEVFGWKGDSQ